MHAKQQTHGYKLVVETLNTMGGEKKRPSEPANWKRRVAVKSRLTHGVTRAIQSGRKTGATIHHQQVTTRARYSIRATAALQGDNGDQLICQSVGQGKEHICTSRGSLNGDDGLGTHIDRSPWWTGKSSDGIGSHGGRNNGTHEIDVTTTVTDCDSLGGGTNGDGTTGGGIDTDSCPIS